MVTILQQVGRFVSEDSYKGTLPDPQSQNRYVYCVGNPLRYVDPSGHIPKWLEYIPGVGAVVYTVEGTYYLITGKEPDDGWEAWSERTFNAGVNTFFTALIMYDLGIGTKAITFGKGAEHFGKTGGKPKLNLQLFGGKSVKFASTPAKHMENPARFVPVQTLELAINSTKGVADPRGSNAMMHYTTMIKNGKTYNLEVLYDKASNTIYHFEYARKAMGDLPAIQK